MNNFIYKPIVPQALWEKYSLLEIYPFDGGGGFINRALLGTLDDREIRRKFLAGELSNIVQFPNMDFHRNERWRSIELSCWINRCYLVACLAHAAWLEKDKELANVLKDTMLHFIDTCPPPGNGDEADLDAHWKRVRYRMNHDYNEKTFEEYSKDETDVEYIWYDFQPASRVIHFLHTLHFIRDLADFKDGELQKIIDGIRLHGHILYLQEKAHPNERGNHQSVRQIGLLHAASAFTEDDEIKEWKKLALARIAWHATTDFYSNGVLFENSPSYHSFETWHGRDALAFAKLFNAPLDAEAERRFKLAGEVLATYRRPDGRTLVFNDAYPLHPAGLLESMGIDVKAQPKKSLLDQGGLAVWRGEKLYAALDVSSFTGQFSHYHAGKNALIVFLNERPFIDDPGCCNYDSPSFRGCKQATAHSSMMVDGTPDAHSFSLYGWDSNPELELSPWEDNKFSALLTSSTPEWAGVKWRRTMVCGEDGLDLRDEVTADKPHDYEFHFTAAPGISVDVDGKTICLRNSEMALKLFPQSDDCEISVVDAENYQTDPALPIKQVRILFKNKTNLDCTIQMRSEKLS